MDSKLTPQEFEVSKITNNLIKKSPVVWFLWKKKYNWPVEFVSDNVETVFGYTKDDFMSEKVMYSEIIHPDDIQRVQKEVISQSKTGTSSIIHEPYRIITKTGEIKWLNDITLIRRNKNNEITHYEGIVIDIIEQYNREKSLKESERKYKVLSEQFRLMSDNIPDLVWSKDLDGNFTFVNKAVCEKLLIAKDTQEPIGKKDMYFAIRQRKLYPDRKDWHTFGEVCINSDEVVLKTKKPQRFDEYGNVKGKFMFLDVYKAPIFDNTGKIIGTVGHGRIVTKEKEAEKQLKKQNKEYEILNKKYIAQNKELEIAKEKSEESNRLKSAFLANMSHEIRTPMNSILGFAQLLKDPSLEPESKNQFIDIINNSANHLLNLINDIIDISKIDANQMNVIENECKLNEFLFEIHQFFHSEVSRKKGQLKIVFKKGLADGNDVIKTDITRLRQILINLMGNAVKFTHEGLIEVKYTLTKDKQLLFSIKDTGIGIHKKDLTVIFERFRQSEEASTRKYGGTGLGLAISKACVELLDGKIWVESQYKKGSSFYFTIPYKKGTTPKLEKKITIDKSVDLFEGKTILVVEDDIHSTLLLEIILKPTKATILNAKDGFEAIEVCKKNTNIHIILMDVQLPKLDGLKTAKEVKKILPHVPIISQTANAMHQDKQKSLDAGCVDYITKPINKKELLQKIAKYML